MKITIHAVSVTSHLSLPEGKVICHWLLDKGFFQPKPSYKRSSAPPSRF